MPKIRSLVAALAAITLPFAAAVPAAARGQKPAAEPTAKVIVLLDPSTPKGAGALAAEQLGRVGAEATVVFRDAVKGYAASLTPSQAAALRADPSVEGVFPDQIHHVNGSDATAEWGLDRIDQRALPLSGTYDAGTTGAGVTAYVIDTGIRTTHREFGGRAVNGIDTVDGGPATDCHGHGTHVAGTIGGSTYGVAEGVKLVAVRVLDCEGSGSTSGIIKAIDWAISDHRTTPAVANMSLGGPADAPLDRAIESLVADGVSVAVAAGNESQDACATSPARVPSAITTGASDVRDHAAEFTNFGRCVDVYAPGVDIKSSVASSDTATAVFSGTSMASPHVAGAAARYLQGRPTATPAQVQTAIKSDSTKDVIVSAAAPAPAGRADIERVPDWLCRLVPSLCRSTPPPAPAPPTGGEDLLYVAP